MLKKHNIPIGEKIWNLTIISDAGRAKFKSGNKVMVLCLCDCGNEVITILSAIKKGNTKSCGCLSSKNKFFHLKNKIFYKEIKKRWDAMIDRCHNPLSSCYYKYGAVGIFVCEEWRNSLESFYEWCVNNGFEKSLQLDRIDTFSSYSPKNCRFVTAKENSRNKRRNVLIEWNGMKKTIGQWAEYTGMNYSTISGRFYSGWNTERIFTQKHRYLDK